MRENSVQQKQIFFQINNKKAAVYADAFKK